MKEMGNTASNQIYNPKNTRPPIPIDADEADSAMERFIRAKYQDSVPHDDHENRRDYASTRDHASTRDYETARSRRPATGSDSDDHPPAPPPKTTSRFGFRSASSIFPMSSKARREASARAYLENQQQTHRRDDDEGPTPPRKNKPSRVFGTTVASEQSSEDNMIVKLAKLRDMGFADDKRNITILKGLNGNFEKSVETLVRLGERSERVEHSERSGPPSRSRTPATMPLSAGLSIDRSKDSPISPTLSNNPWEIPPAQAQSSQSTGGALAFPKVQDPPNTNDNSQKSLNPFGLAASRSQYNLNQQYSSLGQSFQNLSVSPNQPLFPNHTGGVPNRQPFQAAAAPPMPSIPQGQYASAVYDAQPQAQYSPNPNQGYNPFLPQQTQQPQYNTAPVADPSNPFGSLKRNQTFPVQENGNFGQSQQQPQGFFNSNQTQSLQQDPYGQHLQAQQQMPQQQTNPFNLQIQQQQPQQSNAFGQPMGQPQQMQQQPQNQNPYNNFQYQQQQAQPFQQQQQLLPQPTGRADKTGIMALFNYPQPAVSNQLQPQTQNQILPQSQNPYQSQPPNPNPYQAQSQSQSQNIQSFTNPLPSVQEQPQNVPTPLSSQVGFGGSKNPFMHNATPSPFAQTGQSNGMVGSSQGGLLAASGIGGRGSAHTNGNVPRHLSQESMSVNLNGWHGHSGRHSPDAFASLSARAVR